MKTKELYTRGRRTRLGCVQRQLVWTPYSFQVPGTQFVCIQVGCACVSCCLNPNLNAVTDLITLKGLLLSWSPHPLALDWSTPQVAKSIAHNPEAYSRRLSFTKLTCYCHYEVYRNTQTRLQTRNHSLHSLLAKEALAIYIALVTDRGVELKYSCLCKMCLHTQQHWVLSHWI
jgi:hypothetical protein